MEFNIFQTLIQCSNIITHDSIQKMKAYQCKITIICPTNAWRILTPYNRMIIYMQIKVINNCQTEAEPSNNEMTPSSNLQSQGARQKGKPIGDSGRQRRSSKINWSQESSFLSEQSRVLSMVLGSKYWSFHKNSMNHKTGFHWAYAKHHRSAQPCIWPGAGFCRWLR